MALHFGSKITRYFVLLIFIIIAGLCYIFIDYEITVAFVKEFTTTKFTTTTTVLDVFNTPPPVDTPAMSGFERNFNRSILIVSFMRSGSSFVGEFFNVHPEVFYMFEPLHALGGSCLKSNVTRCLEFLREHLECRFTDRWDQRIGWNEFVEAEPLYSIVNQLDLKGNFIFRHKSKRLCQYPFCNQNFR